VGIRGGIWGNSAGSCFEKGSKSIDRGEGVKGPPKGKRSAGNFGGKQPVKRLGGRTSRSRDLSKKEGGKRGEVSLERGRAQRKTKRGVGGKHGKAL